MGKRTRQSCFVLAILIGGASCDFAETTRPTASNASTAYMDLSTLDRKVYPMMGQVPNGLYIIGKVEGDQFIPEGHVKGSESKKLCEVEGWLELRTNEFHWMKEARTPMRPYLEGAYRRDGFCPASRTVQY